MDDGTSRKKTGAVMGSLVIEQAKILQPPDLDAARRDVCDL
jgi:hypothetical protein